MLIQNNTVIFENKHFSLTIGSDCLAQSLIYKPTGEECLMQGEKVALFSATQNRPYHNEVKLAHPNKKTTFQANSLRVEDGKLIVGFETVPYEAVVEVTEADDYIAFRLLDFITHEELYGGLVMTLPPVVEFCVLQLPIKERSSFGEWLNVSSGAGVSVAVLGTSEYPRIDSECRCGYRVMYADCRKEVRLKNVGAALVVSSESDFLTCIDRLERDFGLPLGVESRARKEINESIYWTNNITPENVDEHIAYAKQGGFRLMMIYCNGLFGGGYELCGGYELIPMYANGGLEKILAKIKAAGITPGLHFLQTFIGKNSHYVTPVADSRLGLTRHFTLSRAIGVNDTAATIYVNENPEGSVMAEAARILKFGGELFSYESYSDERPYCFRGCRRGAWATAPAVHQMGEIGGLLDVCEYGAQSCYIDQSTDLQDEVAENIARIYNLGFEFIYFDGSEGTQPPFEFNVPNAQYRVLKKLGSKPIFTMGAAKAHFSWHFLSGGNAFDVFPAEIFKAMIDKYPAEEAERLAADLTVVNFGWWSYFDNDAQAHRIGTQPDMYEYGTSRAAAYDCPVTMMENLAVFKHNPRTADNLEVMRRWEEVRAEKWLTAEQKQQLRQPGREHEHILLLNENREFELQAYRQVENAAGGDFEKLRVFVFERRGFSYAVYWNPTGEGQLRLSVPAEKITLYDELYLEPIALGENSGSAVLPNGKRRYLKTSLTADELAELFVNASIVE